MINKTKTVIYLLISLTLTISIFLMIFFDVFLNVRQLRNETEITFQNQYNETFKIDLNNFNPGDKEEYKVDFKCLDLGTYNLKTSISNNKGELFKYITLDMLHRDELLIDKMNLYTYLTHPYTYQIDFGEGTNNQIIYRYSLDEQIGNEIQNLSASFNFEIELKKVVKNA